MPVSALPAMRATIAYSAATASGETWAEYANSVLNSLLAIEFRNAPSLAGATLYGSTPSVTEEPGGGLVLSANGLECSADTVLDSGVTADGTQFSCVVISGAATSGVNVILGSSGSSNTRHFIHATHSSFSDHALFANGGFSAYSAQVVAGTLAVAGTKGYLNGSDAVTGLAAWSGTGFAIYIGGRNSSGSVSEKYTGNIAAVCIGTLKDGQDADTVASELYTRMATAAL